MYTYTKEVYIETSDKTDFIDVSEQVKKTVQESKIKNGICNLFTKHTTTAIRINENEPRLMEDIKEFLEKIAPCYNHYKHDEIDKREDVPVDEPLNGHSHLKSLLMGASENVPIINGNMELGTWQRVFFVELDGPRQRKMIVHIIGDKNDKN